MTEVSQFVSGHEQCGDTSIAVKLVGELQSKSDLVNVANSVEQYQVVIGNRKWLGTNGFNLGSKVNKIITDNEGSGQTVVLVGINGMYIYSYSIYKTVWHSQVCRK